MDFRSYILVASTNPFIVVWKKGYMRKFLRKFQPGEADVKNHVSNL